MATARQACGLREGHPGQGLEPVQDWGGGGGDVIKKNKYLGLAGVAQDLPKDPTMCAALNRRTNIRWTACTEGGWMAAPSLAWPFPRATGDPETVPRTPDTQLSCLSNGATQAPPSPRSVPADSGQTGPGAPAQVSALSTGVRFSEISGDGSQRVHAGPVAAGCHRGNPPPP